MYCMGTAMNNATKQTKTVPYGTRAGSENLGLFSIFKEPRIWTVRNGLNKAFKIRITKYGYLLAPSIRSRGFLLRVLD